MGRLMQFAAGAAACALLQAFFALYALVPKRRAYSLGCALAAAVYPLLRRRRAISIDNILKAGVASSREEAALIAKRAFCHLAGHIAEALKVPSVVDSSNWREHLDFSEADPEAVKLLLDTPDTPILIVSAHHGVWEAATNVISFARPMIAIARTLNNPVLARWMKRHHFRGPVTVIDKNHGFSPSILRQWEREASAMTILVDQHSSKGIPLDFLGRKAKCFTSATRLAVRTGRPVIVGTFVRKAPFVYGLVGGAPVSFPRDAGIAAATQLLNDRLGACIRAYPEQYLWMHKRWRI